MLLSCYAALNWHWSIIGQSLLLVSTPLWEKNFLRLGLAFALSLAFFGMVKTSYHFPNISEEGIPVLAEVELKSLTLAKRNYGQVWTYRGILRSYISLQAPNEAAAVPNIPVTIALLENKREERALANCSYYIKGILKKNGNGGCILTRTAKTKWVPLSNTWSAAEWRYKAKKYLKNYLQTRIADSRSLLFLQGIATGEFSDKQMIFEFSRFGLQHIMAISGFHFAILALFLSLFFRLICSKKTAAVLTIAILSLYFLFLGSNPSVMRAWISIVIALGGYLIQKNGTGLNSLGIGMLAVLFFDPLVALQLGFQFSFAVTASILIFYPLCRLAMEQIFEKRAFSQILKMNYFNQHGYLILVLIKDAVSLALAVNLTALPMSLYFFHKVPVLSLIYNLFFPFLASLSMILLITASVLDACLLNPLAMAIHRINETYTINILNLIFNLPIQSDWMLRVNHFSTEFFHFYLTLLFGTGIILRERSKMQKDEQRDLVFV